MSALPAVPRPTITQPPVKSVPALGDGRNGQMLLGTVLVKGTARQSNEAYLKIAHFKDTYFVASEHRIIYKAMSQVFDEGLIVEFDSVLDRLKKMENKKTPGRYAIDEVSEDYLVNTCAIEGGNLDLLIKLVTGEYIRRNDISAAHEKIKWAMDGNLPLDAYLEKSAYQNTENMTQYASLRGTPSQSMSEGIVEVGLELGKDRSNSESEAWLWHCGLVSLDTAMGGGLEKSTVSIFGGRPGDGKSIMLQKIATAVMNQGGRPFILSVEMLEKMFWRRMLVAEIGVEWDRLKTGNLTGDERMLLPECLKRMEGHKMGGYFRIEYMRMPTLVEMRRKIAQESNDRGIDVLLLDYASWRKIKPVNDKLAPNIQQGLISEWLTGIAKEFKIPVVSAAQMSREIEKRGGDPVDTDLEYSVAMEQDADFIGLFKADDTKLASADYTIMNCHVVKSRNGAEGVVPLKARKHLFKFEDMRS